MTNHLSFSVRDCKDVNYTPLNEVMSNLYGEIEGNLTIADNILTKHDEEISQIKKVLDDNLNEQKIKEYLKNNLKITVGMGKDLDDKAIIFKLLVDNEIVSAYSIPSYYIKQMVSDGGIE